MMDHLFHMIFLYKWGDCSGSSRFIFRAVHSTNWEVYASQPQQLRGENHQIVLVNRMEKMLQSLQFTLNIFHHHSVCTVNQTKSFFGKSW